MGTPAYIIVERQDGKYAGVHLNYDGYPSHAGRILKEFYNTQELAEKLVSHGDMSSLDESCEKPEEHSYDHPVPGYTIYYGRDHGETGVETKIFDTLDEAYAYCKGNYKYIYFWCQNHHNWLIRNEKEWRDV